MVRKLSTREKILEAAFLCFVKSGYESTTVDEIACQAGVSKGGIYWHFKSKFEIFTALLEQELERFFEIADSTLITGKDLEEIWEKRFSVVSEVLKKNPKRLILFLELVRGAVWNDRLRELFFRLQNRVKEKISMIFDVELKENNIFLTKEELNLFVNGIEFLLRGIRLEYILGGCVKETEKSFAFMMHIILTGLKILKQKEECTHAKDFRV